MYVITSKIVTCKKWRYTQVFCCLTPLPYQVPGSMMSCWVSACYACWFHARYVIEYLWLAQCLCLEQSKIRQTSSGHGIRCSYKEHKENLYENVPSSLLTSPTSIWALHANNVIEPSSILLCRVESQPSAILNPNWTQFAERMYKLSFASICKIYHVISAKSRNYIRQNWKFGAIILREVSKAHHLQIGNLAHLLCKLVIIRFKIEFSKSDHLLKLKNLSKATNVEWVLPGIIAFVTGELSIGWFEILFT